MSKGKKQLHFGNRRSIFAYVLYNFCWTTTTIKGHLKGRALSLGGFGRKNCPILAPKLAVLGVEVVKILNTGFATPKVHPFVAPRLLAYFASKSVHAFWL